MIHVIDGVVKDASEVRAGLALHPEGVIFYMEDPRAFGFDPDEIARRENSGEPPIPAEEVFRSIRAELKRG